MQIVEARSFRLTGNSNCPFWLLLSIAIERTKLCHGITCQQSQLSMINTHLISWCLSLGAFLLKNILHLRFSESQSDKICTAQNLEINIFHVSIQLKNKQNRNSHVDSKAVYLQKSSAICWFQKYEAMQRYLLTTSQHCFWICLFLLHFPEYTL